MDTLTPEQRRRAMSAVRSADTTPEVFVRRLLHALGYRFRLHRRDLPGRPDIVLPRYRAVILVHGCFWHQHPRCERAARPSSRREYWDAKLDRNVARDAKVRHQLAGLGWRTLTVWECQIKDRRALALMLCDFLEGGRRPGED